MNSKTKLYLVFASLLYIIDSIIITAYQYSEASILSNAENGDSAGIIKMVIVTVLLLVLSFGSSAACATARLKYVAHGTLNLKHQLVKSILHRPMHRLRRKDDEYYLNLLSNDADTYTNEYLNVIPYIFASLAAIVSAAFMLIRLNIILFAIAVTLSFIPMLLGNVFTKPLKRLTDKRSEIGGEYTGSAKQIIEGNEAIRSSNAQEDFIKRFDGSAKKYQDSKAKYTIVSVLGFQTLIDSAGFLNIICLAVGGYLALNGKIQISMLFAAVSYFTSISNGVTNIMDYIIEIKASKPVREKLMRETEEKDIESASVADKGTAEFKSINFSFGDKKLYEDFDHTFTKGSLTAIIGESGSGKSTLTKLLRKYYTDYEGEITLSGTDIKTLSEQEIYRHIGVVEQSTYLFNASLYDNITMFSGVPAKDSQEYKNLLKRVNLDLLDQQVGDDPLGDFGGKISGGERQRIALARVLRTSPEIIIFDEPTTGLDPENARLINEEIFSLDGITRIVISHDRKEEYLARFDEVIMIGN